MRLKIEPANYDDDQGVYVIEIEYRVSEGAGFREHLIQPQEDQSHKEERARRTVRVYECRTRGENRAERRGKEKHRTALAPTTTASRSRGRSR